MKDKFNHTENYYRFMTFLMYLVTIVCIGTVSYMKGKNIGDMAANSGIGIVCVAVISFYMNRKRYEDMATKELASYGRLLNAYWILFVFLIIMTFIPGHIRPVFLAGVVMTMLSDVCLGLLFQIYFSVMMTILASEPAEILVFYLISGIAGCMMAKYFTRKKDIPVAAVTLLGVNTALSCLLAFSRNKAVDTTDLIGAFICTAGGIFVILMLLPYVYYRVQNRLAGRLHVICDENYELIIMLRNYSKDLYEHSVRVARLSELAAEKLGADPLLAKAGGYYHKIGKLEGKDYVNYGVEVAESYAFPEEVIDIIRQHNGRQESPKSVEAAVVMLADTIISAFEYLDDRQNELIYDKSIVIEQVINTKLENDLLDDSRMTLKMFRDLKKCFMQEENIYDI